MALMTPAEVITAAFYRKVDAAQIKTTDVEIAEFQYIRPLLTENLYNLVVAAPTTTYATLVTTYIKPCLAFYTKYLNWEDLHLEVSDRGINQLTSQNANPVSNDARTDGRQATLDKANILAEKLRDYVVQQWVAGTSAYSTYMQTSNVYPEAQIVGGFLVDEKEQSQALDETSINILKAKF